MPFARVRDIRMYYERGGDPAGPRLMLVNGSGGDLRHEPSFMHGPLAAHFDLLGFDQRGLGQTEQPDAEYTMADYAADALALLDHVGWQRCRLMGISFGGMVAQEIAVTAPERIERLVLACTSPGGAGGSSYPLHELAEKPAKESAALHVALMDTRGEGAGPLMEQIAKILSERGAADGDSSVAPGFRRQLEARRHHDTFDRLDRLTMPVLIAAGRYDGIAAPSNQEAMHAAIAGSRLEWFDGGHVFMLQDPRANEVMGAFLLEGGGAGS